MPDDAQEAYDETLALYRSFDTETLAQLQRQFTADRAHALTAGHHAVVRVANARLALIRYVLRDREVTAWPE